MTWEETIQMIRKDSDYLDLVEKAYFDEDLPLNIERFAGSDEFQETLKIVNQYQGSGTTILDIGSGNGVSAVNFARKGYVVTAVEPDTSETVGAGAIELLKKHYDLENLTVHSAFAEDINFESNSFDVVYIRQAMHHANDLEAFMRESVRVLKPGGLLLTVRDHVIYDEHDKAWFLEAHPLHKFYGGENAYTALTYKNAIEKAGAEVVRELKYYDSVINYFPVTSGELIKQSAANKNSIKKNLKRKLGIIAKFPFVFNLYCWAKRIAILDEKQIPGRMYSYIAIKR